MKHHRLSFITISFLLTVAIIYLSSCVPQKKILYLQKAAKDDTTSFYLNKGLAEYKVQPKDNLYIKVSSLDEKSYQFFNRQGIATGYADYNNDASIYLTSYSIDDNGDIELAILGKIHVRDMTVNEVADVIQKRLDEYLKQTMVTVKLVNFTLTIIGEVTHPGEFKIYQDRINLFEALSLAGDMTEFANRNQVALVRHTETGSKIHYLDLTSDKILKSEFFYLMPKDVIVIAPLSIKRWGFTQFPYNVLLTSFSVLVSIILLVYTVKHY
jgi:polysaccharide biosynthesis/export protein